MPDKKSYPQKPVVAVGAVVVHKDRVLMVKRRDPPSQGLWAIPGGSLKLGESLQQGAEREIFEETAIKIKAGLPVYSFDNIQYDEQGRVKFHYVIIDLQADYICGVANASDDALKAAWLSPAELLEKPVNKSSLYLLQDVLGFVESD